MSTQCSEWTTDLGYMDNTSPFIQGRVPLFMIARNAFFFVEEKKKQLSVLIFDLSGLIDKCTNEHEIHIMLRLIREEASFIINLYLLEDFLDSQDSWLKQPNSHPCALLFLQCSHFCTETKTIA